MNHGFFSVLFLKKTNKKDASHYFNDLDFDSTDNNAHLAPFTTGNYWVHAIIMSLLTLFFTQLQIAKCKIWTALLYVEWSPILSLIADFKRFFLSCLSVTTYSDVLFEK